LILAPHFLQTRTFSFPSFSTPTLVALLHFGQTTFTLLLCILHSTGIIPPSSPCFLGLICFFLIFIPLTITLSLLGIISNFTNSIAWGFNFLWASLFAMLIKFVVKQLRKRKVMNRVYINNYQMDRISGFAFDIMIVAGVSAIEINDIRNYIVPIIILSVLGALITHLYIRKVSKECFKGFEHEFYLMSFGTLTGTASNGMILMKEVDPGLKTPTSSLYILSNFPAMVMIAPLLFLLGFAGKSLTNAIIACCIFFVLWLVYSIFLFRRKIFKKHYKDKPVVEWVDEKE
jgi:ESS family glutamate:Na+ symporter